MAFRHIFEELHWVLESLMSAVLTLLRNSLFYKAVIEKDFQQNLSVSLSLTYKKNQIMFYELRK